MLLTITVKRGFGSKYSNKTKVFSCRKIRSHLTLEFKDNNLEVVDDYVYLKNRKGVILLIII